MRNKIAFLLFLTLLLMSCVPVIANYFLIEDILISQQKIYRSQDLTSSLLDYEHLLRKTSRLDPNSESIYREQFSRLQDLKLIYGDDTYFSETVRSSIFKYFFIGFGLFALLSLISGLGLSVLINSVYTKSFDALIKEREKSQYLKEMAQWQEVAKKMAHEIRRPLQPIRIWLSNLRNSKDQVQSLIGEATLAIDDEVKTLSHMVDEFSQFASLPTPTLQKVRLNSFLSAFIEQYNEIWPSIQFHFEKPEPETFVLLDVKIFKTVFTNLIENAYEANLDKVIDVHFKLTVDSSQAYIEVHNSGSAMTPQIRAKVFDLYFSTKENTKNMGLGLAIVKSLILEHSGDIQCLEVADGVTFKIELPLVEGPI